MPHLANENFPLVFGILTLAFLFINYETSIKIIDYLKIHGEKYSPTFFRINIFKILNKYRQYKLLENKRMGKEFYTFLITFFLFATFAFLCIISIFVL